jgi:thiol:disulfide interchange protein DsbD
VAIEALAEQPVVRAGQTLRVALVERIQPGWHTYWINPGDAGQATKLHWTLPPGYRVDDVQWPVPQVFRAGSIVSYGYEGQAVLLQTVHAPATVSAVPVRLSVDVQWLACRDICIPEHGAAQITLSQEPSSVSPQTSAAPAVFAEGSERLPRPSPWPASLRVDKSTVEVRVRGLASEVPAGAKVEFLPLNWGEIDNAAAQLTTRSGADLILTLARGDLRAQPLAQLNGVLVVIEGHGTPRQRGFFLQARTSAPTERRAQS